MLVLGIESTCDETGCALVRNGKEILSNVVATQEELHHLYGGVIPELACRRHIDVVQPLLQRSLLEAHEHIENIDLIAVAYGPGLVGALLIGMHFAKGLSLSLNKPLIGVNHIEAHLYSVFMDHSPPLPALGVILSGGHTLLVKIEKIGHYQPIGQTQDDAIGEAFDKVAKMLQLPYPGGPHIENLARQGDPLRFPFKGGEVKKSMFDLSFSGLKTAVLYLIKGQNNLNKEPTELSAQKKADIAASFQHSAFSYLVEKIKLAAKESQAQSLVLGGGVTQNRYVRDLIEKEISLPAFWPSKNLSLDNAAMIAGLGMHTYLLKGGDTMQLNVMTRIPFNA